MVIAIVFVLISCDNDPTELGSDFLGIDIDNTIIEEDFDAVAFSARLNPVQTNNLGAVQLGAYDDPIYGRTTYDFVTQVGLRTPNVDFGVDRRIDSVVLTIPYFSTQIGTDGEATLYRLDSVYGGGTINFQMFRNNFFLNNFDANDIENPSVFFSDLGEIIDSNKGDAIEFLEILSDRTVGGPISEITNFTPSPDEVVLSVRNDNTTATANRVSPRFRRRLEPTFWEQLILDQNGASFLQSDGSFRNFFRGLYFRVTNVSDSGSLAYLNLTNATIEIFYTSDIIDVDDSNNDGSTTDVLQDDVSRSFVINIIGNRVTLLNNEFNSSVIDEIENSSDVINGSERLYLKGGEGAITLIDLFGPDNDNDGEADALTDLIARDVLVNEANLEFYVDQDAFIGADPSAEPERIFIYDFERSTVLSDFIFTGTGLSSNLNHLGRLQRVDGNGLKYRIRLTQHISNILIGNAENNRLGLFVSQNVAEGGVGRVKNQTQPIDIEFVPVSAGISHEGTVLHGNLSEDPDKRLKLKIFYTEVN